MLPRHHPDRIRIAFDDHRLVANAGLILPATLARRLGLPELVHNQLDLGRAPGRANTGDKMLTLVASALAGGDCIDDADVLRTGGTTGAIGCVVKAPSTLGPSSGRGGLRNQVYPPRVSTGNGPSVSGRPGGAVTCGKPVFPKLQDRPWCPSWPVSRSRPLPADNLIVRLSCGYPHRRMVAWPENPRNFPTTSPVRRPEPWWPRRLPTR